MSLMNLTWRRRCDMSNSGLNNVSSGLLAPTGSAPERKSTVPAVDHFFVVSVGDCALTTDHMRMSSCGTSLLPCTFSVGDWSWGANKGWKV